MKIVKLTWNPCKLFLRYSGSATNLHNKKRLALNSERNFEFSELIAFNEGVQIRKTRTFHHETFPYYFLCSIYVCRCYINR